MPNNFGYQQDRIIRKENLTQILTTQTKQLIYCKYQLYSFVSWYLFYITLLSLGIFVTAVYTLEATSMGYSIGQSPILP